MKTSEAKRAADKAYYEKNKDKVYEVNRRWVKANAEKVKEYKRKSALKNKDKVLEYAKEYRKNNQEKIKSFYGNSSEYKRERYKKNKEKMLKNNREWQDRNIEHLRKYRKEHKIKKWHTDTQFKFKESIRHRIYLALVGKVKSKNTEKLIGCSFVFLKAYLQEKFTEGMSWENYCFYGWHVDHIIPCASFDLTKEEEQKKCFHYTNLQPLWAKDNIRKSSKIA